MSVFAIEPKATVLIGRDGIDETASVEVITLNIKGRKICTVDLTANHKLFGIGISKDIYNNKYMEIDAGMYVTQDYMNLFKGKIKPQIKIGLSGKFKLF